MKSIGKACINAIYIACWLTVLHMTLLTNMVNAEANGDIDGNGSIDIADTILALQICAQPFVAGAIDMPQADVNKDGKIGIEEAVYTLQVLSSVISSPFADEDMDTYSANEGDCDDSNNEIYPDAPDSCNDGVDQSCDGQDPACPAIETYAEEDFSSSADMFIGSDLFELSLDRLSYIGHTSNATDLAIIAWNGGGNPSNNLNPQPENSNYFTNFHVSVDAFWWGGDTNSPYGLIIDLGGNDTTATNYIVYRMAADGRYDIQIVMNGQVADGTGVLRSFLRAPIGEKNTMSIEKEYDYYRFYLNGTEIERLTISGFSGGGIGLYSFPQVTVSFDNLKITSLAKPSPPGRNFPNVTRGELNTYVYKAMKLAYYWYKDVPQTDPNDYTLMHELLDSLKHPLDNGSYIAPYESYINYIVNGIYTGLGIGLAYDKNGDLRITFVYPDSPAYQNNLSRGDKVLEINDKSIQAMNEQDFYTFIDTLINSSEKENTIVLNIETASGTPREVQLLFTEVSANPVLHHKIIEHEGKSIGYLAFQNFISPALDQIVDTAFTEFSNASVDELVLDLRYNGGAYHYIAQVIAAKVAGSQVFDDVFLQYQYNDKFTEWNYIAEFGYEVVSNALNLDRLVVITSKATCSSSEIIVNSLRPLIDVVTIGDTTCGNPMGAYGYFFYDYYLNLMEYKGTNANGQGDFYSGITPTCEAIDDLTQDLGDTQEDSFAEALNYISSGTCSGNVKQMPAKVLPLKGLRREIGAF